MIGLIMLFYYSIEIPFIATFHDALAGAVLQIIESVKSNDFLVSIDGGRAMETMIEHGKWDRFGRQGGGDASCVFGHRSTRRHNPTHGSSAIARDDRRPKYHLTHPADSTTKAQQMKCKLTLQHSHPHSAQLTDSAALLDRFPNVAVWGSNTPTRTGLVLWPRERVHLTRPMFSFVAAEGRHRCGSVLEGLSKGM